MQAPVIVLGGGGHTTVLIEILELLNREVIGLTCLDCEVGSKVAGITVLGNDEVINQYSPTDIELVNGVGPSPKNSLRLRLSGKMSAKGFVFAKVIHPSATISRSAKIHAGAQIMAGCVLQSGVVIGENTIVNTSALIDHDSKIGSHCHISPGAVLCGGVQVQDRTYIGAGSTVIEGIHIGEDVVIAAGSIVYSHVDSKRKYIQQRSYSSENN
jgi:sugar O-acyltransferase (sialic acid O-acetyltransferase NeuD family)